MITISCETSLLKFPDRQVAGAPTEVLDGVGYE